MKVKVLYFASLKERLLKGEDTVEVPEDVKTVEDRSIWWLGGYRGDGLFTIFRQGCIFDAS